MFLSKSQHVLLLTRIHETAAQNITQSSCDVKPHLDQSYIPIGAVFLVFSLIAVGMRFASSFSANVGYGWTDRFLGLALVCPSLFNSTLIAANLIWRWRLTDTMLYGRPGALRTLP